MKRHLIDASQLELEDKVVSIKRVTKVVTRLIDTTLSSNSN